MHPMSQTPRNEKAPQTIAYGTPDVVRGGAEVPKKVQENLPEMTVAEIQSATSLEGLVLLAHTRSGIRTESGVVKSFSDTEMRAALKELLNFTRAPLATLSGINIWTKPVPKDYGFRDQVLTFARQEWGMAHLPLANSFSQIAEAVQCIPEFAGSIHKLSSEQALILVQKIEADCIAALRTETPVGEDAFASIKRYLPGITNVYGLRKALTEAMHQIEVQRATGVKLPTTRETPSVKPAEIAPKETLLEGRMKQAQSFEDLQGALLGIPGISGDIEYSPADVRKMVQDVEAAGNNPFKLADAFAVVERLALGKGEKKQEGRTLVGVLRRLANYK